MYTCSRARFRDVESTERSGSQYTTINSEKEGEGRGGETVDEEEECGFLGMVVCVGDISNGLESKNCVFRDSNLD